MNIIFHRYNSICAPDFIEAFTTLGINVIEDRAEMTDKHLPLESLVSSLGEAILINKPFFVFSINFFPYISMVCEKLGTKYVCVSVDCPVLELFSTQIRNKCNRVFLFDYRQYLDIHDENPDSIFYMPLGAAADRIDRTIGAPEWEKKDFKYDVSFVGSLYTEKNPYPAMYGKLNPRYQGMSDAMIGSQILFDGQELLEQAVPNELTEAVRRAEKEDFPNEELYIKSMDSFWAVNNYFSRELTVRDRKKILASVAGYLEGMDDRQGSGKAKLHIFTRSSTSEPEGGCFGGMSSAVFHGGVRTLDEMPLVFRQSRINLNPTMRSIRTGLPQRVWDIMGAGGFLLTNYQAELPEYFEIGRHLEAYGSAEEACEKIEYYLSHEDERLQIARNGYELVKSKHRILDRVMEIIRIITEEITA